MDRLPPSAIGARAEMAVASALHRAGYEIFVPLFAPHSRVDAVVAGPDRLLRVQSKTSRLVRGAITFRTCSNTSNVPLDYRGEVDAFGVFSPELDRVYLVPIDHMPVRRGFLRVMPAANGQRSGIRWAADYEVGPP